MINDLREQKDLYAFLTYRMAVITRVPLSRTDLTKVDIYLCKKKEASIVKTWVFGL